MRAEFARAFRLHEQGKLREAFLRYDAILKAAPEHAPALHYSGVVLFQSGKLVPAEVRRCKAFLAGPGRSSALFDTVATTRALEAVYEGMATQYRQGVRRSFRVEALPSGTG